MRLTKVLVPEVVKASRSSGDVAMDKVFAMALAAIEFDKDGVYINSASRALLEEFNNINFRSCFVLAKRHLVDKAPTYHICKDFGEALLSLKDRQIVEEYLPESFLGYFSFPLGLINEVQGAYVYLGPADEKTPFMKENRGRKVLSISYFGPFKGNGYMPLGRLNFFLDDFKTLEDVMAFYESDTEAPDVVERLLIGRLVLNAVLYINSQDPEILALKPSHGAPVSKQKAHTVNGHTNLCTIPVMAINWDYKRIYAYEDSESFVNTFLRWQRCGVGNSQIKLTWVKEHTRHYKKRIETEPES